MQAGSVVASRFEILGEAGAGGMGTVYRAHDRESGQLVALKLIRTRDGESFDGEALLLQSLAHPGIVRYIAHGREAEGPTS